MFALPSDLRFCEGTRDKTLRVVVARKKPRQTALFRGKRGGRLESAESRIQQPLGLTGGVTHVFGRPRRDRPGHVPTNAPHENALEKTPTRSRSPPTVLGSATFSFADCLSDDRRASRRARRHARPARRFRFGFFTRRRDFGHHHACIDKPRMEPCLERRAKTLHNFCRSRSEAGGVRGGGDARQRQARCARDVLRSARETRRYREKRAFGGARRGARDSERAGAHLRPSADGVERARTRGGGSRRRDEDPA